MSTFTTAEIQEIKARLGYTALTASARPFFDIARVFEDIVQNFTNDYGIARVRTVILPQLNALDGGTTDATGGEFGAARQLFGIKELVGDVIFETGGASGGRTQTAQLASNKEYWLCELESVLGVKRAHGHHGTSVEQY